MSAPGLGWRVLVGTLVCAGVWPVQAQEDAAALRRLLEEQRALIEQQARQLQSQQRLLDELSARLKRLETADAAGPPPPAAPQGVSEQPRDLVGDLNAESVRAGTFPGAIRIPGTGDLSLAIGGSVKLVAIGDSHAEAMGADFLPASLGTTRPDREGAVSLDATLTRLFIDGRAPLPSGQLRGYVEYDLNAGNNGSPDFKLRHAYGTWTLPGSGMLTAGHTWSTLMDLAVLPEGLTEPTVSGVIFNRQALLRWSGSSSPRFAYHVAIEDPSSSDVASAQNFRSLTSVPDLIGAVEFNPSKVLHFRLGAIYRRLRAETPAIGEVSADAGGATLTGRYDLLGRDKLLFSAVYGEGLGRYFLGIRSDAASLIDFGAGELKLRKNAGGMLAYQHYWNDTLRSTAMAGYAESRALSSQPPDTFEGSKYFSINLMKRLQPYLTLGIEYAYGENWFSSSPGFENHRIAVGIQMF